MSVNGKTVTHGGLAQGGGALRCRTGCADGAPTR